MAILSKGVRQSLSGGLVGPSKRPGLWLGSCLVRDRVHAVVQGIS